MKNMVDDLIYRNKIWRGVSVGYCCRKKLTVLNQTPSAFQQFLQDGSWRKERLCLRYVIFGGEMLEVKKAASVV